MAEPEEKLVLKPDVIKKYLSCLEYTQEKDAIQYSTLIMANKRIEALNNSILEGKHVKVLDLSGNNIVDINLLQQLTNVVKLNLARNKIKNVSIFANEENFQALRWLDISSNKYVELPAIKAPKLEFLDISFNRLEKINENWAGHPSVRVLKTIDNKFKNLAPFKDCPKLEELFLAQNLVSAISGFESMPTLRKLNLRKNKIEKLEEELPTLEGLTYLNLRGNRITSMAQIQQLFQLYPALTDLNVISSPVERSFSSFNILVAEILIVNPKVKRFNKFEVTDVARLEAVYLAQFRWQKAEEERLRKEEEERRREEMEAANQE